MLVSLLLSATLASPDGKITVTINTNADGVPQYSVRRKGADPAGSGPGVLRPSPMGLVLEDADLSKSMRLVKATPKRPISEHYTLATGKRSKVHFRANEAHTIFRNAQGQELDVTFRVANDGFAFRYTVGGPGHKQLKEETTGFAFQSGTRAWLQPMQVAQTGWKNTNPAYEEHYKLDIPAGTPAPTPAGWVFPALFKSGDTWLALTEADMDGSYQASRLQAESPDGVYKLGQPMAPEVFTDGKRLAEVDGTLRTPWRVVALGPLATVMESTLGTDLAAPAKPFDAKLVKPGKASWSWALLKDEATVYEVQQRFIDYAAEMGWQYTLIDADWDRKIGDVLLAKLVKQGQEKQVGILVWYNSSGAWNGTEYSPKSKLLTPALRKAEFAKLRELGVKGVKVDFFPGDGASAIAYYLEILKDAAEYGLLVNFHGATLPRGWSRTWPNLMTAEAVKGLEFTTFTQADQDAVPRHAAMLPFARNLFDPMDFTPMVFGDIPNIRRATRNGFELAESVLFVSGIQHFAETPEGMATVPAYVKDFLRQLPVTWDETRFIAGEPGKYVVLARRAGKTWYVAGINADKETRDIRLDVPFKGHGTLIGEGEGARSFIERPVKAGEVLSVAARGGFVATFR